MQTFQTLFSTLALSLVMNVSTFGEEHPIDLFEHKPFQNLLPIIALKKFKYEYCRAKDSTKICTYFKE